MAAAVQIDRTDDDDGTRIRLSGSMRLHDAQSAWDELRQHWEASQDKGKSWSTLFDGLYSKSKR